MTSISYLNESERSSISVLRVSILPLHVYTIFRLDSRAVLVVWCFCFSFFSLA